MKIQSEVMAILNASDAVDNKFYLPNIQLERSQYMATNKVLESIGLKWNKKEKCHIADYDIEDKLCEILETSEYLDVKKEYQFFETPDDLACRMVRDAEIKDGDLVLEPSAGRGAIVQYMLGRQCKISLVELLSENYKYLKERFTGMSIFHEDFLQFELDNYNAIVMNPPFSKQQDIDHILHAYKLLAKGGRLIAICGTGALLRKNKKSLEFQEFLKDKDAYIEYLPEGAFKESGTMVNTALIEIVKGSN